MINNREYKNKAGKGRQSSFISGTATLVDISMKQSFTCGSSLMTSLKSVYHKELDM